MKTRSVMRGKKLKSMVERWFKAGPVCPRHGIPSERVIFKIDGRNVRGWRCKQRDFEVIHPKDAEALFRAHRVRTKKRKTSPKNREQTEHLQT